MGLGPGGGGGNVGSLRPAPTSQVFHFGTYRIGSTHSLIGNLKRLAIWVSGDAGGGRKNKQDVKVAKKLNIGFGERFFFSPVPEGLFACFNARPHPSQHPHTPPTYFFSVEAEKPFVCWKKLLVCV